MQPWDEMLFAQKITIFENMSCWCSHTFVVFWFENSEKITTCHIFLVTIHIKRLNFRMTVLLLINTSNFVKHVDKLQTMFLLVLMI